MAGDVVGFHAELRVRRCADSSVATSTADGTPFGLQENNENKTPSLEERYANGLSIAGLCPVKNFGPLSVM